MMTMRQSSDRRGISGSGKKTVGWQRWSGFAVLLALILSGCQEPGRAGRSTRAAQGPPPIAAPPAGAPSVWPASAPHILARHAIMIDARTGRTLYQKNADILTPVASTQKLLTGLLVVRDGSLDQTVRIQHSDTLARPAKLGFRVGEVYSRRALLTAMIVKSENDAAAALARDVAGSEAAFVADMNRYALELGARNSRFANPHGLPADQFSTARDMARVAFRAYREPTLRQMMATKNYTFFFTSGRRKHLENTNKLLGRFSPVNGMKTGYTIASGRCLIASASYNGRDVILVQIGSRTSHIFDDAERMLRWGLGIGYGPLSAGL